MNQVKYPRPKLAVLLRTLSNKTAKAGLIVRVIGHDKIDPAYLIAHPKITGHSGDYGLAVKKGRFVNHCWYAREEDILFVVK